MILFYTSLNYKNRICPCYMDQKVQKEHLTSTFTLYQDISVDSAFLLMFLTCVIFLFYFKTLHIFYQAVKLDLDPLFYLLGSQPYFY